MKKLISNLNLYILLLAPVFILSIAGIIYQTVNVELLNVQTEIVGLFNRRTIFEVLCEVVKKRNLVNRKMSGLLNGLVLAGGKSTRMGVSKAAINWHGKEQQYYLADLMKICCEEVFISCREDQVIDIYPDYNPLPDQYHSNGPIEAILSAFQKYPDSAWLVIACDVPLMDLQALQYLIEQRGQTKIATAFESPEDGLPEPLIAVWEPESYELLKLYHQKPHLSLRKILIKHQAKIIKASNADALISANTPDEAKRIFEILEKRKFLNK